MNRHRGFSLILVLFVLFGCSSEPQLTLVAPVEGKVTVDGKALEKGNIGLHPDKTKGNNTVFAQLPVGEISNGTYKISTGGRPGAPAGWYKVTITSSEPSDPKNEYSVPKLLVEKSYTDAATTSQYLEVKEGAAADSYDLKLRK